MIDARAHVFLAIASGASVGAACIVNDTLFSPALLAGQEWAVRSAEFIDAFAQLVPKVAGRLESTEAFYDQETVGEYGRLTATSLMIAIIFSIGFLLDRILREQRPEIESHVTLGGLKSHHAEFVRNCALLVCAAVGVLMVYDFDLGKRTPVSMLSSGALEGLGFMTPLIFSNAIFVGFFSLFIDLAIICRHLRRRLGD